MARDGDRGQATSRGSNLGRERVIVDDGARTAASARSVTDAVRTHFRRHRIDPARYRSQIPEDLSSDPGDGAHAAACIYGTVDVLLTRDATGFQAPALAAAGVHVTRSDDYLCTLLTRHPHAVTASFTRTAASRKNPPVSAVELAAMIANAGAPTFAGRIHTRLHLE